MAVVRVYLCTYRRNELLQRALDSLLAQTFTDWVCELHNDDPEDPFPSELVRQLGDSRITSVTHKINLGPTVTFNLFFQGGVAEKYFSILEDDNWWTPDFLRIMVQELESRPTIQLAWANMKLWQEQADGSWQDTGRCVWNTAEGAEPILFHWPDRRQICGALHSNGAMLARTEKTNRLQIPDSTPFAMVEHVRERRFIFPILFVPVPLANFAITRATSRGRVRSIWEQGQALLTASFFRHVRLTSAALEAVWNEARNSAPPSTNALLAAALIDGQARYLLKHARIRDWLRFLASLIRRPVGTIRMLKAKSALSHLWNVLDCSTRATHEKAGSPTVLALNRL